MLMYIDETAANEHTVHRRYGWAEKGQPVRLIASAKKCKKWSILPLYTYDGFVDWMIVHGSFNADLFIEFLQEHVIPHTNYRLMATISSSHLFFSLLLFKVFSDLPQSYSGLHI